jgi:GNAT superfamily N-acetyltransferase
MESIQPLQSKHLESIDIVPLEIAHLSPLFRMCTMIFVAYAENPNEELLSVFEQESLVSKAIWNQHNIVSLRYWIAMKDNQPIGLIGAYERKNDQDDSLWCGWFGVDPQFQGQGIGKKLRVYFENEAKRMGKSYCKLFTSAEEDNNDILSLYKKWGYEISSKDAYETSEIIQPYFFRKIITT